MSSIDWNQKPPCIIGGLFFVYKVSQAPCSWDALNNVMHNMTKTLLPFNRRSNTCYRDIMLFYIMSFYITTNLHKKIDTLDVAPGEVRMPNSYRFSCDSSYSPEDTGWSNFDTEPRFPQTSPWSIRWHLVVVEALPASLTAGHKDSVVFSFLRDRILFSCHHPW